MHTVSEQKGRTATGKKFEYRKRGLKSVLRRLPTRRLPGLEVRTEWGLNEVRLCRGTKVDDRVVVSISPGVSLDIAASLLMDISIELNNRFEDHNRG